MKANQLMPKPAHLSWEEAAVNALCNSTSYRMLVSKNGAQMKQGDVVLIWGATAASAPTPRSTCSTAAASRCAS